MKHLILGLVTLLVSIFSFADTTPADSLLTQSKELFSQRADPNKVDKLVQTLTDSKDIIDTADTTVKFQLQMYLGRALYFKATHAQMSKEDKLTMLEKCMSEFKIARSSADLAETYMWYSSALGRWAETKGILESLSRKDELLTELNTAMTKETLDGAEGKIIEGYGPNRVIGRIYAKLPFFAGGSRSKAKENLDIAYNMAPLFPLNVIYRAELYANGSADEKTEACASLDKLLSEDARSLDPNRIPENMEEFTEATQLKSQICN